jgi:hypothetical protein
LTAETDDIVRLVFEAVVAELSKQEGILGALCQEVARQAKMLQDANPAAADRLRSGIASAQQRLTRLLKIVQEATDDDDPVHGMVKDIRADIARMKQELLAACGARPECEPLTVEGIKETFAERGELLKTCPEEFFPWMRSLVPEISLYPVTIKGVRRRFLEARFKLSLVNLLPGQWRIFMQNRLAAAVESIGQPLEREIRVIVNPIPRYALVAPEVQRMVKSGMKVKDIMRHLNLDRCMFFDARRVMKQQDGDELKIIPVDTLPNLRRKRKPAGPRAERGEDGKCPVSEELARQIMDMHATGYKSKGIADDLGCRTSTVERFLKWLDSQPNNELDGHTA